MTACIMLFMMLTLFGCVSPVPFMHQQNTAAIEQLLEQSASLNQATDREAREDKPAPVSESSASPSQIPQNVLNALIPKMQPGKDVMAEDQKRFSVAVKDQPARAFFLSLAKGSDYSIMVSPEINGNVTLSLDNVTIAEVLEATRGAYGYEYRRTAYGYDVLPKRLESRIFNINRLNISRTGSSTMLINSPDQLPEAQGGGGSSDQQEMTRVQTTNETSFWRKLEEAIRLIIGHDAENSKELSVVVNPESGVILVKAYPQQLRQVAEYLDKTQNVMSRQVVIEAKIVEVTLNDSFKAGIDWGAAKGDLSRLGMQFLPFGGGSNTGFVLRNNGNAFQTAINLLNTQGTTSVLSSPRIATLNNQKAVIKVGTDEYFSTNFTTSTATSTVGNTTASDLNLKPFFSGVALDVTPQIDQEGRVTLHIHPVVSDVQSQEKTFIGASADSNSASLLSTSSNKSLTLTLAKSNIRESDSIVHAKSGEVVVIGGLMQRLAHTQHQKMPSFAGAFPDALAGKNDQGRKSELVILLRAMVVSNSNDWNLQISKSLGGFSNVKR